MAIFASAFSLLGLYQESGDFLGRAIVDIFGFVAVRVFVATPHLCQCGEKAATDSTEMTGPGCVPIRFYYRKSPWAGFGPRAVVCRLWSMLRREGGTCVSGSRHRNVPCALCVIAGTCKQCPCSQRSENSVYVMECR